MGGIPGRLGWLGEWDGNWLGRLGCAPGGVGWHGVGGRGGAGAQGCVASWAAGWMHRAGGRRHH